MDPSLAKLLWLVGLIGVGIGVAGMLLRVDKSTEWSRAHIAQLVLNRHGGLDLAAVAFWFTLLFDVFVLVYCLFKGNVPDRFDILLGAFNLTFAAPIVAKIFKGSTGAPSVTTPLPLKTGDQS
jgi:hypothetical protein